MIDDGVVVIVAADAGQQEGPKREKKRSGEDSNSCVDIDGGEERGACVVILLPLLLLHVLRSSLVCDIAPAARILREREVGRRLSSRLDVCGTKAVFIPSILLGDGRWLNRQHPFLMDAVEVCRAIIRDMKLDSVCVQKLFCAICGVIVRSKDRGWT